MLEISAALLRSLKTIRIPPILNAIFLDQLVQLFDVGRSSVDLVWRGLQCHRARSARQQRRLSI